MPKECLICLSEDEIENNPFVCYFSDKCSCNIFAHKECISEWRNENNNKNKCPNCRTIGNILELEVYNNQSQLYLNIPIFEHSVQPIEIPIQRQDIINPLTDEVSHYEVIIEPNNNQTLPRILEVILNIFLFIGYIIYGIFLLLRFIIIGIFQLLQNLDEEKCKKLCLTFGLILSLIGLLVFLLNFDDDSSNNNDDYNLRH